MSSTLFPLLDTDPWPMVRSAVATTLGQSCADAQRRAALTRTATRDVEPDVQRAAIRALVTCAPGAARETLLSIARADKQSADVRTYAVLELVNLSGPPVVELIDLLESSRRRAFDSDVAQKVAAAAATALGRIADPRARRPLLQATLDEAYPDIQAAAIAALAGLCDADVKRRLRQLSASPQRTVSLAARRSLAMCK